jgi:hypothetical protein
MPVLVDLVDQPGDVVIDLSLESNSQHPPGALTNDLIKPDTHLRAGIVITHYSQHRRSFLAGASTPASLVWFNEEGTPRPRTDGRSTGSGYNSWPIATSD